MTVMTVATVVIDGAAQFIRLSCVAATNACGATRANVWLVVLILFAWRWRLLLLLLLLCKSNVHTRMMHQYWCSVVVAMVTLVIIKQPTGTCM